MGFFLHETRLYYKTDLSVQRTRYLSSDEVKVSFKFDFIDLLVCPEQYVHLSETFYKYKDNIKDKTAISSVN